MQPLALLGLAIFFLGTILMWGEREVRKIGIPGSTWQRRGFGLVAYVVALLLVTASRN